MMTTYWARGLLVLGLGGLLIAGCATALLLSEEAGAETQRTGTPFSNPTTSTTQAGQATTLTPEQEAALVEVRRILKESKQAAERFNPEAVVAEWIARGITPPIIKSQAIKDVQSNKALLLGEIERAQFRAGDLATASTTKQHWGLVLSQLRYGALQGAVQTASEAGFATDETLVTLKMLSDAGDLDGALKVAKEQTRPGKNFGGTNWRQKEAELLAYVARRQSWAKNPEAPATLREAMYAVRTNKDRPKFQYWGAVAVGCAQATMDDHAGAAESFRQGIQAATAIRKEDHEGERVAALSVVGRAAAQSGLQAISREAFQEAMKLASQIPGYKARVDATANLAVTQFLSNDRAGGTKTFEEAVQFAESLSPDEQRNRALSSVIEREIVAGERGAAQAILERRRRRAESLPDSKERQVEYLSIRGHEARLESPREAVERAYAIQNDSEEQASRLGYAANRLIHSKEPVLTPEILHRLSQTAETLLAKPLPNDQKKADQYLSSLARVQAVASGTSKALETIARILDFKTQRNAQLNLLALLVKKKDIAGARQVLALFKAKEEDLLWGSRGATLGDTLQELGRVHTDGGDIPEALTWSWQQQSHYARAEALLGVALGIMEQQGIYDLDRDVPTVKWLVGKGPIDKLAISCGAL